MEAPSNPNGLGFIAALLFTWVGYVAEHTDLIEIVKVLFQCFAWGGAGAIGVVTVVKFLQDNGFIRKGKIKK